MSSPTSRYTSYASLLQFPSGVKTYLWNVPSTQIATIYMVFVIAVYKDSYVVYAVVLTETENEND